MGLDHFLIAVLYDSRMVFLDHLSQRVANERWVRDDEYPIIDRGVVFIEAVSIYRRLIVGSRFVACHRVEPVVVVTPRSGESGILPLFLGFFHINVGWELFEESVVLKPIRHLNIIAIGVVAGSHLFKRRNVLGAYGASGPTKDQFYLVCCIALMRHNVNGVVLEGAAIKIETMAEIASIN
ncbi:hypothetical protein COCVIDRAFT_30986 [Bipolaris victoriae FI3]|uniref:Uncharacterized protein n=1 Tax=Bipolaris victoriae (strain FI3) TaxID=930091 RepID=W7E7C3_BIPV3|nr:hypothetical protein COCVIDRAFT_30986 [Bipolaris victoriae FI3]